MEEAIESTLEPDKSVDAADIRLELGLPVSLTKGGGLMLEPVFDLDAEIVAARVEADLEDEDAEKKTLPASSPVGVVEGMNAPLEVGLTVRNDDKPVAEDDESVPAEFGGSTTVLEETKRFPEADERALYILLDKLGPDEAVAEMKGLIETLEGESVPLLEIGEFVVPSPEVTVGGEPGGRIKVEVAVEGSGEPPIDNIEVLTEPEGVITSVIEREAVPEFMSGESDDPENRLGAALSVSVDGRLEGVLVGDTDWLFVAMPMEDSGDISDVEALGGEP